jgi:hypothetical protein
MLVGKSVRKRPFGRCKRRCEENIKVDLKEIMCVGGGGRGLDWIHLIQVGFQWWALVNTVMNLQVP